MVQPHPFTQHTAASALILSMRPQTMSAYAPKAMIGLSVHAPPSPLERDLRELRRVPVNRNDMCISAEAMWTQGLSGRNLRILRGTKVLRFT